MSRVAKVAISLPEEVLNAVERARKGSGESRSQFFRRAIELLLRYQRERAMSEQYIRAYQRDPETKDEIEASRHAASAILAGETWQ